MRRLLGCFDFDNDFCEALHYARKHIAKWVHPLVISKCDIGVRYDDTRLFDRRVGARRVMNHSEVFADRRAFANGHNLAFRQFCLFLLLPLALLLGSCTGTSPASSTGTCPAGSSLSG